jgi:hypothetical protein
MFEKILHANDGSEPAFHALGLALAIARQNNSELHMVSVEEIDSMPEFIEEVRQETGGTARRFHKVLQRARWRRRAGSHCMFMFMPGIPCATLSNSPGNSRSICLSSVRSATPRSMSG